MRRVAWLTALSFALTLGVLACSGEDGPPSTQGVGDPLVTPAPRPRRQDPIYGPDGLPRESDEQVAGLVIPLGLDEIVELRQERRHVYSTTVPHQKVLRYFGPRLNTVQIDHVGSRVTYREALVQGARGGQVKLDVTIAGVPGGATRVTIYERPPPPPEGTVVTEEAIRSYLDELHPTKRE